MNIEQNTIEVNKIIKNLNDHLIKDSFNKSGHAVRYNFWISDIFYTIEPNVRYLLINIPYTVFLRQTWQSTLLAQFEMGINKLKKKLKLESNKYIGNIYITQIFISPNYNGIECSIIARAEDISKLLDNEKFKNKLEDLINE